MRESLSFNCAKTDLDFSSNLSNKEDESVRATTKEKSLSKQNVRKQLALLSYKNLKQEYNIFEKLSHFAVYRLKVTKLLQVIHINSSWHDTNYLTQEHGIGTLMTFEILNHWYLR